MVPDVMIRRKEPPPIHTVPSSFSKSLITIKGRVGRRSYQFILDTGASGTVVSRQLAQREGLAMAGKRTRAVGAGGRLAAHMAPLKVLRLGTVEVRDLPVAVVDLARLGGDTGLRIDGVIGNDVLSHYRVVIDYPARQVLLARSRRSPRRPAPPR